MTRFHQWLAICLTGACLTACTQTASDALPQSDYTPPDYATAPLNLSTPENAAYSMMIAMYRGDTDMIDQTFIEGAALRRLSADGEIRPDGLAPWRDWVATLDVGKANETLFQIEVERFNNLATVWAPFVIDVDGKRVGCGVNQFTMAELNGDWRIVAGIDVQAPKSECETFEQTYKSG